MHALVHDVLGHERCAVVGGDIGGVVGVDLVHRFDDFVERFCFFNTVPPAALDEYAAAGTRLRVAERARVTARPATTASCRARVPDELAAMLPTDAARRQWIAGMYQSRLWASPGTFGRADVDFMTEPFADEARLRAGWSAYQLAHGRPMTEPPLLGGTVDVPTLLLYGTDDHVVGEDFVWFCERAFTDRIGPLLIPGAGHFLQWERADIFNPLLISVFGDLSRPD